MKFSERLEMPKDGNPFYTHFDGGGYSICVKIKGNSVLHNCVGWSHGRIMELMSMVDESFKKVRWDLPADNPITWVGVAKKLGWVVDMIPALGASIIWNDIYFEGKKTGHVATIEQVSANGDVVVSSDGEKAGLQILTLKKAEGYLYNGVRADAIIHLPYAFEAEDGQQNTTEDYSKNTIQNRFIVMKNGKQDNCYTNWGYATARANKVGGVIVDRNTGKQIYPEVTTAPAQTESAKPVTPVKKELTATSYPNYTGGGFYRVRKSFTDEKSSMGSFSIWKYAFNKWTLYRGFGYHIYDKEGNQLD